MINKHQLRYLITEVLKDMEPEVAFSREAVEILLMIAAHESHLGTYVRQRGGPALGIFQIEPATEADIFESYLKYDEERMELVREYFTGSIVPDLMHNLGYQIVLARLQLTRKPGALPKKPEDMAVYAKKHWNSVLGEATEEEYLNDYKRRAL